MYNMSSAEILPRTLSVNDINERFDYHDNV